MDEEAYLFRDREPDPSIDLGGGVRRAILARFGSALDTSDHRRAGSCRVSWVRTHSQLLDPLVDLLASCMAARDHGQHIVGINSNPMAIRLASERTADLLDKISFRIGDIGDTGVPAAAFDGGVSLDVLLFVPDKEEFCAKLSAF